MTMRRVTVALALISGCGGTVDDAESAQRAVPADDVLCQVYAESRESGLGASVTYGSLASDVIAAWGEPTARDGSGWRYEWCVGGGCERKAVATLVFAEHELCLRDGGHARGQWVTSIKSDELRGKTCWIASLRNKAATCAGCLNAGEVMDCR